jgi:transcriptional regulator with XRE-family HTH domain
MEASMATANEPIPDNRVLEWGRLLRRYRLEARYDYYKVANHCGVARFMVQDWENGIAIPNHDTLRRLYGLFHKLEYHKDLLPRPQPVVAPKQEDEILKAPIFQIMESHQQVEKFRKLASQQQPKKDPEPPPPQPEQRLTVVAPEGKQVEKQSYRLFVPAPTFGGALRFLRDRQNLNSTELANMMGVTASTISSWETGRNFPILSHYEKLLKIFPDLLKAPRPDVKDWEKPDSSGSKTPKNATPPPLQPVHQPPQSQQPPKPDFTKLGAAYANALSKMTVIKDKVDQLTLQLLEAEEDLKRVQREVDQAHDELKKATGAT